LAKRPAGQISQGCELLRTFLNLPGGHFWQPRARLLYSSLAGQLLQVFSTFTSRPVHSVQMAVVVFHTSLESHFSQNFLDVV